MDFDVEEQQNCTFLSCKVVHLSIWIVADVSQKNVPLLTWIEAIAEIIQMTAFGRVDIDMGRHYWTTSLPLVCFSHALNDSIGALGEPKSNL